MPKLKSILSRVILGQSRQEEDGSDYLCAGFEHYIVESHSLAYPGRDDNDDGNSTTSFSTTATADNLPRIGRTLDTYVLQPMGRRIERLAMRFTIASLDPARIAQYIEADHTYLLPSRWTPNVAMAYFCRNKPNGSTVVAGMKGLVRQTQSTSIYRCASALAALVRVSLAYDRCTLYVSVSRIKPIFHLETLAGSLACSHPEKKWFLFLVKLARETLVAFRGPDGQWEFDPVLGKEVFHHWPSPETALALRQRLIRVLGVYRSFGLESLDDTIGEACAICAEAMYICKHVYARGNAYMHALETVYFTVIFVLRSIHELADDYAQIPANRQINMILQTLASWIDATIDRCINAYDYHEKYDVKKLDANVLFRGLVDFYDDTTCVLLPECRFRGYNHIVIHNLPRRHQSADDSLIAQRLIEASKHRAHQLLRSFNELEREVCGISLETRIPTSHSKIDADPYWNEINYFGDEWWKALKKALEKARRVQVPENLTTEEFREARRIGLERDPLCDPFDLRWDAINDKRNWVHYQLRRGTRHKWGQYLRSNMDWDWDLGTCMKRLFKESHSEQLSAMPGAPASTPTIGVAASPDGALQLSFRRVQVGMPKEVQISYETEDGKMQYMSFLPATPGPGLHLVSSHFSGEYSPEDILGPTVVQQHSGYREGSSGGEQGTEDLEAGASSSDAWQPEACDVTVFEERKDDCEGNEQAYDVGGDEVRVGGDTISICSLD